MSESTQVEIGSLADCRDVFIYGKMIIEGYSHVTMLSDTGTSAPATSIEGKNEVVAACQKGLLQIYQH